MSGRGIRSPSVRNTLRSRYSYGIQRSNYSCLNGLRAEEAASPCFGMPLSLNWINTPKAFANLSPGLERSNNPGIEIKN